MQEEQLIDALKQRDETALSTVFERYANKIYQLGISLLQDEVQADGVVQNTFLKLIEHIDSFEGRAQLSTWLYRVAYNECMGRLRQQKKLTSVDEMLDEEWEPDTMVDWKTIPDDILSSQEALSQVQIAVQSLSPNLRAVFILRDVEELSTYETAQSLDISESAVKVRLHRARLILREKLAHYFEEYLRS